MEAPEVAKCDWFFDDSLEYDPRLIEDVVLSEDTLKEIDSIFEEREEKRHAKVA